MFIPRSHARHFTLVVPGFCSWCTCVALGICGGLFVVRFATTGGPAVLISLGLLTTYGLTLFVTARREGTAFTPITTFFGFAVTHAILGFYSAAPAAVYLIRPRAGIYNVFDRAFLIVSLGLTAMMLGYLWAPRSPRRASVTRFFRVLQGFDLGTMNRRARVLVILALPTSAFIFWNLGQIPLFSENLGRDRYVYLFRPEFLAWTTIYNRCREVFLAVTPLLVLSFFRGRRRFFDLALILLSLAAMLSIAQRGPLVSVIYTLAVVSLDKKQLKFSLVVMPVVLAGYLTTQYYMSRWVGGLSRANVFEHYGNALPELRDLAWVMSSDLTPLWGSTFLQALSPLPSSFSEFQRSVMLRSVTLDAVGIPLDAGHGGLRITFAGECFINFGMAGVLFLGFLYGTVCSAFSQAFALSRADSERSIPPVFLISSLWVLFSFWFYLGGTAAAGVIKFVLLVMVLLCVPLRRSRRRMPTRSTVEP